MKVEQISKGKWFVEVTDVDKKKLACIINKLKNSTEPLPTYGKWKDMNSEDIWEEILIQFCVMGGAQPIDRLLRDEVKYDEFLAKLSIEMLSRIASNRREYIARQLKEYKATRFYNKRAEGIEGCLRNEEIIKDGKIVFLDGLKKNQILDEDQMRDVLLKKLPFFKMKSISDFMITIGAAKGFIAFDTRVVGLLTDYFGLNIRRDDIQYDKILYKSIERKLRDVCGELGIELSLLDRILFKFSGISAIESILKTECV